VRVLEGDLPATEEQASILTAREIQQGWRLACRSRALADVTLEVSQWDAPVLTDDSSFDIVPRPGLGVAVDLGTTTLVAQLVDLTTGKVLSVQTSLNPQAAHGADVMSRVQLAISAEGRSRLQKLIHREIGRLLDRLLEAAGARNLPLERIVIVGNSVMHHLFSGLDVTPLAYFPFEPLQGGLQRFGSDGLGWRLRGNPRVLFLPCLGGFVGSDILAGILSTKMLASSDLIGLIDLGTNGEVVFGNRDRIVCASTAAGPAFEGARIRMGMRAATGAISEVSLFEGGLRCHVLGGGQPRGICGSGLVDAISTGLNIGVIKSSGRFAGGLEQWIVCPPVFLEQSDIRELQLAKAAIAAAIQLLLRRMDARPTDVSKVYLAGAFGNYIDRDSARRIGLIDFSSEQITPAGNTALRGAKLALFRTVEDEFHDVGSGVEHLSLSADPEFEEVFVRCMTFPEYPA
jgi:uncharacterized 2Fe-2S/4Fe-4S cluster protein (DUF4445 family)